MDGNDGDLVFATTKPHRAVPPNIMKPDSQHPISDLDARFTAVHPNDTSTVIEALRKAGVYFDVTINGPKDTIDSQSYDVFWFKNDDDMATIGAILRAHCTK